MQSLKRIKIAAYIGGFGLCLCAWPGSAAPPPGKGQGKDTVPGQPVSLPSDDVPGKNKDKDKPEKDKKPKPEHPHADGTGGVSDLVNSFNEARTAFLAEQAKLRDDLRKASAEERKAIRELIRENLKEWIAERKAMIREERKQRDAIKEIIEDEDFKEVVDESREGDGRGRGR